MSTIEIDFDVFKALTALRTSETETYNAVLRKLLKLQSTPMPTPAWGGPGWVCDGVTFPSGTEFRAKFKRQIHTGRVDGSALVVNGERFTSPSAAAVSITGYAVNGWRFWDCKRPSDSNWINIDNLRHA